MMITQLPLLKNDTSTLRVSSWDKTGGNADRWMIKPRETRVFAEIEGPGCITHLWMTQDKNYRECLLRFTWDDSPHASIVCPLGDFFGLGHNLVNSYQSLLFSASTNWNNTPNKGVALNCYVQMPFRKKARIELINESDEMHRQYFYIDYEKYNKPLDPRLGYFHAEFRRENPFGGWANEIKVDSRYSNISNKERSAWDNNYVILDTKGRGHYIGCNLSVTNFQGEWWGEGDDMIWVDGYKWPPELHGTGSEDYLGQAWAMQPNAFLRNGTSLFEKHTNGYQTSYVHHIENPVYFQKEIKVTIEHGHANHLCNEMSSVAYWYAENPGPVARPPSVEKRLPVLRDNHGNWLYDTKSRTTSRKVPLTVEMKKQKSAWKESQKPKKR